MLAGITGAATYFFEPQLMSNIKTIEIYFSMTHKLVKLSIQCLDIMKGTWRLVGLQSSKLLTINYLKQENDMHEMFKIR